MAHKSGDSAACLQLADAGGDVMPEHDVDAPRQRGLALPGQHTFEAA